MLVVIINVPFIGSEGTLNVNGGISDTFWLLMYLVIKPRPPKKLVNVNLIVYVAKIKQLYGIVLPKVSNDLARVKEVNPFII